MERTNGFRELLPPDHIRGSPPSELLQYFREHNRSGTKRYVGDYLKYFVDFIQESPSITGLGIWGCTDEIFYPKENAPCGYGPWGVVDGFRREKPEFWHMKMSYSPIIVTSKHFEISGNETLITLDNRYNTLNTNQTDIIWKNMKQQGVVTTDILPGRQEHFVYLTL